MNKDTAFFTVDERKTFIAESLTELRKLKGWAQKEVADAIGVSQATYSAYERARNEPNAEMLVRLANLYGVTVDVILQRDRRVANFDHVEDQIVDLKEQIAELENLRGKIPDQMIDIMQNLGTLIDEVGKVTDELSKIKETPGNG